MPANIRVIDLANYGLITAKEACEILDCTPRYLERLVQMQKLRPVKFSGTPHGGPRYYEQKEVAQYRKDHPRLGTQRAAVG